MFRNHHLLEQVRLAARFVGETARISDTLSEQRQAPGCASGCPAWMVATTETPAPRSARLAGDRSPASQKESERLRAASAWSGRKVGASGPDRPDLASERLAAAETWRRQPEKEETGARESVGAETATGTRSPEPLDSMKPPSRRFFSSRKIFST